MLRYGKYGWGLLTAILWPFLCGAQLVNFLTQPWSYSVNYTFGRGTASFGPPMTGASTDLSYSGNACPIAGEYAITNRTDCPGLTVPPLRQGGHEIGATFYYGYAQTSIQPPGYWMLASYGPADTPRILFAKTITGLCGNRDYLFWAAIRNLVSSTCFIPHLTFQVETLTGTVIASFPSGPMGQFGDNARWYIGFYDPTRYPQTPFYGGTFTLPAGVSDIVVKIIIDPAMANAECRVGLDIDNIELTPMGPDLKIFVPNQPNGYQAGACFQGNVPLVLNGQILSAYAKFGTPDSIPATFANPQVQWQESLDSGYTWQDIPGETGLSISHVFNVPDTFYVRMRAADGANINNLYCSVVSNLIRVNVDSTPIGVSVTSNSPVCEDSDVVFKLQGGATYITTGPNGYFADIALPHVYHPTLADSGWYYVQVFTTGGCSTRDSTHVVVRGPRVTISSDTTICYGQMVQLNATGGNAYSWSPGSWLSDDSVSSPRASPHVTTKYQVKVSDGSGCSAFASVVVNLRDSLIRAAFSAPAVACPRDVVAFADSSKGVLVDRAWNFGNGQTFSGPSAPPAQVYAFDNGLTDYTVRLIVTDTSGCADTAVHVVKAVNNCFIAVPSGFTPNGDGHNDYLYPLNAWKATNLVFRVYNRGGELVFETRDWTQKWDGRVNGQLQPTGVYVWTLDYNDAEGQRKVMRGTTVLVR